MSRAREKKADMDALGVVLSPEVRLARNGAKANGVSRSEVERQPKRAPLRCRRRTRIPKWWPKPSDALSPRSINNASCKKPTVRRPLQAVLARFSVVRVCILRTWSPGGESGAKASRRPWLHVLRQPDASKYVCETWVEAKAIESGVDFDVSKPRPSV